MERSIETICEFLYRTTEATVKTAEALAADSPTKYSWGVVVALKNALTDLSNAWACADAASSWAKDEKN